MSATIQADPLDAARASLASREVVGVVALNALDFVEQVFRAQDAGLITVPLRHADDAERIDAAGVTRIVTPAEGAGWGQARFSLSDSDAVAQILFTSGTTGAAKGIALTCANIADAARRLNAVMGLDATVREYVGVPVYYSFGMGRCRAVSAAGGSYYIPPRGFDPVEIAAMLKAGEINAISAVPTLWRLILQNPDLIAPHGAAVKWIEIGSQSMSRAEKEGLKTLFPKAVIVQHYGLTEASRSTFLTLNEETGEALDSVGRAVGATEIKLDPEGRIMIRGPHVAPLALTADGYRPLLDAQGWLTTNDLGDLRNGLLTFKGRADDLINCGGVKLSPETLEPRIKAALGVEDGLVVARLPDPMRGDAILVAFTARPGWDAVTVQAVAAKAAEGLGVAAGSAVKAMEVAEFPRTDTGKIRRQALADQYAASTPMAGDLTARLIALWREALGAEHVGPEDDFFDLGGDAQGAEALIARMEALGVAPDVARGLFDGLTIAEIARLTDGPPEATLPAVEMGEVESRLLAIWREALGRDDVTIHQGFYDVGGDSLSAVAVALGMEKAGFAPEVAHGIFDGLTIAEIARQTTARASEPLETRLLAIWKQALGRDDVTVHQGFYDVGGDSLSAVAVALGMERAGFAPEVAHGIFDGKTIAQLCEDLAGRQPSAEAADAPAQAPRRGKSEIAVLSEASNFIKGIVLLCMVASHWIPIYLISLGLRDGPVGKLLAPIFSLGSPTLAVAFGMGVAIFHQRQLENSPPAFRRNIRTAGWFLAGGLAIGALAEIVAGLVVHGRIDVGDIAIATLSGGPFLYYLLATLSLPLWLRFVRRDNRSAVSVLMVSLALYAAYLVLDRIIPQPGDNRVLEAVREVVVGHWSVFQMAAITLLGVGLGLIVETRLKAKGLLVAFLPAGLIMSAGGILMSLAADDLRSWMTFPKPITLWAVFFYGGLALTVISVFQTVLTFIADKPLLRRPVEWICCLGIILFPLYVAQSVVFHSSLIIGHYSGLNPAPALSVAIVGFLAAVAYPLWRVYRLYYAGRR